MVKDIKRLFFGMDSIFLYRIASLNPETNQCCLQVYAPQHH